MLMINRLYHTLAVLVLVGMIFSGCASQPPGGSASHASDHRYPSEASIIVPDNASLLASGLRHALSERGWHLVDYNGAQSNSHADYRAMAQRAKYRLTLLGEPVGHCRNGDHSFLYRIALINNRSGHVPVALSGADCLTPILDAFGSELEQKQIHPEPGQLMAEKDRDQ